MRRERKVAAIPRCKVGRLITKRGSKRAFVARARERARMVLGTEGDRREKEKSCSSGVKLEAADAIFFLPFTISFLEKRGCRSCYDITETCIYRILL